MTICTLGFEVQAAGGSWGQRATTAVCAILVFQRMSLAFFHVTEAFHSVKHWTIPEPCMSKRQDSPQSQHPELCRPDSDGKGLLVNDLVQSAVYELFPEDSVSSLTWLWIQ